MIIEDTANGMHIIILTERESNIYVYISVKLTRTQRH